LLIWQDSSDEGLPHFNVSKYSGHTSMLRAALKPRHPSFRAVQDRWWPRLHGHWDRVEV